VPELYNTSSERWHVPLMTLIRGWEWWPRERVAMIADEPVEAAGDDLCRIAAVVHALCDRDAVPVPEWVWKHRWHEPLAWARELRTQGAAWERTLRQAPEACAYHNVWFPESLITDPKTQSEARRFAHQDQ